MVGGGVPDFKFVPGSPAPAKRGRPARQPAEGQQALVPNGGKVSAADRSNGSAFEQVFKNVDDVLWKEAGWTTELDYTEQTSWLLFLKYLDGLEQDRATEDAHEHFGQRAVRHRNSKQRGGIEADQGGCAGGGYPAL